MVAPLSRRSIPLSSLLAVGLLSGVVSACSTAPNCEGMRSQRQAVISQMNARSDTDVDGIIRDEDVIGTLAKQLQDAGCND
jgi:hypothetical protein